MIKNILIYNFNEPLPKQGGMERVTDTLARALSQAGYQVYLLCSTQNRLGEVYTPPVPLFKIPTTHDKKAIRVYITDLIKQYQIDCIIDQSEGGIVGKYGFFKNRKSLSDIKLVAVFHSSAKAQIRLMPFLLRKKMPNTLLQIMFDQLYIPLRTLRAILLRRYLYKCLNRNYDKLVMLSKTFFAEYHEFYSGVDETKLIAIPNSNTFDVMANSVFAKEKIVLFVGRLENLSKGVDRLLRIWQKVYSEHPNWQLLIVGDGSDKEKLEQQARDLNLQNYSFEGFQNPRPYYERSQIFCMTSNFEGFGMVLTEAMQFGVVPMAFNSYASVVDIIDNERNGYIIPAFDERLYAEKLSWLMEDNILRTSFESRVFYDVNKFSLEIIISRWKKLLNAM